MAYARSLFELVGPGDPGWENWRTDAEGLLVGSSSVTAQDIAQCPKLKFISRHGVGYDKIAVEAAKERGIIVTNCPGVNAVAVAEVAMSLTCTVARQLSLIDRRIKAGDTVQKAIGQRGVLLTGKTLGLIGGGNIGQMYAKMMQGAFACNILVYDPYLPLEPWKAIRHTRVLSLEEMLPACDIISVHVPLLDSTRGLISAKEFRSMRPTAIVINTARGGIIDENDLLEALEVGTIAGAGIDAWEVEPPTIEHYGRRLASDRLVASPHIGAAPEEIRDHTCKVMCDYMMEMVEALTPAPELRFGSDSIIGAGDEAQES
ncbi:hypothetical protein EMMF5_004131 [Cystobasidiomycetes sp. EMM_F5]